MIRIRTTLWALAALLTIGWAAPAHAQFDWGGERIVKVADLPDTQEYRVAQGDRAVDVGVVYKQVRILFIPLWNYDVRWGGYIGSDTEYLPMEESELRSLAAEAGVSMPATPSLPFWDAWGGKLVVLGIVLLIVIVSLVKRRKRSHY